MIDDFRTAINDLVALRERYVANLERIDQAIAWLRSDDEEDAPDGALDADGPSAHVIDFANELANIHRPQTEHVCPHCGVNVPSARGLAVHVGLKHKPTKGGFNEQTARDNAAAAL